MKFGDDNGDGSGNGQAVKLEDLSPEARTALRERLATDIMQKMMSMVLSTAGAVVGAVPPELLMVALQGVCAGLNRAVGFLEGDIQGNIAQDFKGPDGQTIEEIIAADRERLRLLGRKDRDLTIDAAKKAAVTAASAPKIGFKMPGTPKAPPGDQSLN